MLNDVHLCPKCFKYCFGEYCFTCNINICDYKEQEKNPLKIFDDIFKKFDE